MQEISGSLSEVIRAYSDHNLLVPAATDVQLNPFYKYHVEEVAVDLSENSGDIFKVGSVKTGKTDSKGNDIWQDTYSLSKPLLNKLAMAAGIQFNPHQTYSIGDVNTGICQCDCHKCRVECLKKVDRRTQSTDECFYCLIGEGCSWCTAYNYQVFGTPDARATYICNMHKARALGNIYFWNKYYKKNGIDKRMENHVPENWALDIITRAEWDMLNSL